MSGWIPSDDLFVNRLAWLVRRDGINNVAAFYGRSRQTVRRWLQPRGQRPSSRIRRSVARRGLSITGPTIGVRGAGGRFTSPVIDRRARAAINTINQRRAANLEVARREARTDRQRRMVEMAAGDLTDAEMRDLDRRLRDLIRRDALGEDTADDWRDFEADYQAMVGSV